MTPAQLKKRRTSRGLDQKQAAEELGVKVRQYGNLERGESKISRTIVLLIKRIDGHCK